jgi:hypothetical protein
MVVCFVGLLNFVNYLFVLLCYAFLLVLCILLLCLRILIVMYVLFWVFCFFMLFCVLFVCKCVLYYCHRVSTQLQLTDISFFIYPISLTAKCAAGMLRRINKRGNIQYDLLGCDTAQTGKWSRTFRSNVLSPSRRQIYVLPCLFLYR